MKILVVSHTLDENKFKMVGRWSILPHYFSKLGHQVIHMGKSDWKKVFFQYLKTKPDVIIGVGPVCGFLAILRKLRIFNVPLVHDYNDNYSEIYKDHSFFLRRAVLLLEKLSILLPDAIISCSWYRITKCAQNKRVLGKDLFYISHGVSDSFLRKSPKFRLPGKIRPKIVYVGEQSERKRTHFLVRAMVNVKAELILVGKVNYAIAKTAPKNVFFLGPKKKGLIPSILASADFLILTEDNDSALKLFEYLSSGKPILAPRGKISDFFCRYGSCKNFIFYDGFSEISKLVNRKHFRTRKVKVKSWPEIAKIYIFTLQKVKNVRIS